MCVFSIIIGVCKDTYVVYAEVMTEWEFDRFSANHIISWHNIVSYSQNDVTFWTMGVCRQHYSMNNVLILLQTTSFAKIVQIIKSQVHKKHSWISQMD